MSRLEVEAAIEAALIADGWRIRRLAPSPPPEMCELGQDAQGTAWWIEKRALGWVIGSRFDLPDDMMLEDVSVVRYIVDRVNAEYDQLVHEGVPA